MTITLEQMQELRKGITPGKWEIDATFDEIVSVFGEKTLRVMLSDDANENPSPNGQAIALVPELLEMAERWLRIEHLLTPSYETKAMLMGEFRFTSFSHIDQSGQDVFTDQVVPWTTIKEIMKAISSGAEMKS